MGYQLENGHWIYILAEGRLVNLAAGDGHPAEIMDMSFAIQALSAKYLTEMSKAGKIRDGKILLENEAEEVLIKVPGEVDREVAERKLKFLGKEIDTLSDEQKAYLGE